MTYDAPANAASVTELVYAAQGGDIAALGAVLERYRPALHAQAVELLGFGPAAEDAVHETFVIAVGKIGTLRQPGAVGGWLRRILRNICLMQLRGGGTEQPLGDVGDMMDAGYRVGSSWPQLASAPSAEEELDRLVLRDWAWQAVEELSEPLRLAVMMRFFSSYSSYQQIAAVCGTPVGTVRSRLNAAKAQLAERLLVEASTIDTEERRRRADRAAAFRAAMADVNECNDIAAFIDAVAGDVAIDMGDGTDLHGQEHLVTGLHSDFDAGVKLHLTNVVASREITVAEGRFENPDSNPYHCPPATIQVHHHPAGRTQRLVIRYADADSEITHG